MAGYTCRTYEDRKKIQELWEQGNSVKGISIALGIPETSIRWEMRNGMDGTRLPDMRRRYDADLAQLRVQQNIERRGRRANAGGGAET